VEGKRVLLVEDGHDHIESLLTQILSSQDFVIQVTHSVRAAVDALHVQVPRLVVLDLALTDMPCNEFLERLHGVGNPPVIVLAPLGAEAMALKAIQLGARDAILHPFDAHEAQARISRILQQERLARARDTLLHRLAADNEQLEKAQATWQGLLTTTRKLCSQLDWAELYRTVVETGALTTDADEGYLLLRDVERDTFSLRAWYRRDTGEIWDLDWPIHDRLAYQAGHDYTPVIHSNPDGSPLRSPVRLPGQAGRPVYSLINVPLFHQGRLIGVLGVHRATVGKPFGAAELAALAELGLSATIAVGNIQHCDRIRDELAPTSGTSTVPDQKDAATSSDSLVTAEAPHTSELGTIRRIQYRTAESLKRRACQDALATVGAAPDPLVLQMHETLSTLHLHVASAKKDCHPITLRPIISEVIKQFKKGSPEQDFSVTLAPDLPFGMGVESKIELALLNLVGTARSLGGPRNPVSVYVDVDVDSLIVNVQVKHGGQQPFFDCELAKGRTCSVRSEPWTDVALQTRLFIAEKLIRAQGGRLWTENQNDMCTRFCFTLPKIEVKDVLQAFAD
jgi:two-component system chemotaxis response regulator CheY